MEFSPARKPQTASALFNGWKIASRAPCAGRTVEQGWGDLVIIERYLLLNRFKSRGYHSGVSNPEPTPAFSPGGRPLSMISPRPAETDSPFAPCRVSTALVDV